MSRYAEGRSQRGFVVADETWAAASATAAAKGVTVTSVIVAALEQYVAENKPALRKARRAGAKKVSE